MSRRSIRGLGRIGTLVVLAGCGQTTGSTSEPAAAIPLLTCEGAVPPGELAVLNAESTGATMGPCGEVSYTAGSQVFVTDSSLAQSQLLEGATLLPTFDPHGRSILYAIDQDSSLVYRELRSPSTWSVPLPTLTEQDQLYDIPGEPARIVDFYSSAGHGVPFRCQGTTVYDYDSDGNETAHELGIRCPRALHSGLDALLLGPSDSGYVRVKLGTWETRALEDVGSCDAELCELSLNRRVVSKRLLVSQLMGDAWWPTPVGERFYDAETGSEVSLTALTTPDRGVVSVSGSRLYLAEDLTLAVTDDSAGGKTVIRYFGPNPQQPQRWLTSSVTIEPSRASLHALPSQDLQRIAVWSDECDAPFGRTLLTFAPGHAESVLDVPACPLAVHWVGSDGTLLARVWLDGTEWPSQYGAPLALIYPDNRLELLDIDMAMHQTVRQVVSDGRTLAVTVGYSGPLYAVEIEAAQSREVVPAADWLLTDSARQRLAFLVPASSPSEPRAVWAGAFPH